MCARDRDRDREKETTREMRGTFVAVGTIRCLEPRVVANHLLGVKNSNYAWTWVYVFIGYSQRPVSVELTFRLFPELYYYIFLAFPPLLVYKLLVCAQRKTGEKEKRRAGSEKRNEKRETNKRFIVDIGYAGDRSQVGRSTRN